MTYQRRMYAILWGVSNDSPDPAAFADALVREIKAEMGRQEIGGVRALARMIGMNHGVLNDRLNRSPKTHQRVAISMEDLARISAALGLRPLELVRRAEDAAIDPPPGERGSVTRNMGT